jgi:hypothetical protein
MNKVYELDTQLHRLLNAIEFLRNEHNVNYVVETGDVPILINLARQLNDLRPYVELAEWFIKHDIEIAVNPKVVKDTKYAYELGVECGRILAKIKEQEQCNSTKL